MTPAERYVAAAYGVVLLGVLAYIVIVAAKVSRLERELVELTELAAARRREGASERRATPVG